MNIQIIPHHHNHQNEPQILRINTWYKIFFPSYPRYPFPYTVPPPIKRAPKTSLILTHISGLSYPSSVSHKTESNRKATMQTVHHYNPRCSLSSVQHSPPHDRYLNLINLLLAILQILPRAFLKDLNVHRALGYEAPDMHYLGLTVTENTADCLGLRGLVFVLCLGEERGEEDGVVGVR